jgi:hypothetical protein
MQCNMTSRVKYLRGFKTQSRGRMLLKYDRSPFGFGRAELLFKPKVPMYYAHDHSLREMVHVRGSKARPEVILGAHMTCCIINCAGECYTRSSPWSGAYYM